MADPHDQDNLSDSAGEPEEPFDQVPVDEEPMEVEVPRRAASAEFEVDAGVGSLAAMREAMDPANQSLADALRLSFRVLQMVIVVLVVLFFTSGFQTVGEGQSGVLTRWGRIVPVNGQTVLDPGLRFSAWPYPVGEFVVFDVENRSVTPRDRANNREIFWPQIPATLSIDEAADSATTHDMLRPDREGYVITRDGDMAHLRVNAQYVIDGPVEFISQVSNQDANRIVELMLQRAVVHESAMSGLQEIIDLPQDFPLRVRQTAQSALNDINLGIRVTSVSVPESSTPLAIRKSFGDLQNARVQAGEHIAEARNRARETLVGAAGDRYARVIELFNEYELSLRAGDEELAAEQLALLNEEFDGGLLSGEVARIIEQARAYRSQIESTLGNEARRFVSLLPAFREHPDLVVRQRWSETYSRVLARADTEIILAPPGIGNLQLRLTGSHEIKELRQQMRLDRREQQSLMDAFGGRRGPYIMRAQDRRLQGPGRQLRIDERGDIRGLGNR